MTNKALSFVDRLEERGLVDRWGFLTFAAAGAGAIVMAKVVQIPAMAVAVGAVGIMALYAWIVTRSGTGRLRGDQAGDNCYYLGLIYTLASLAYAIATFDPENTATTIVRGFGIALATTIAGLILRVFFNQTRADLVEVEDTARLELAEAAGKLKAELSRATVSMNDFGRQTRQSLEEARDHVLQTLKDVEDTARATLTEHADESVSKAKRLSTATEKVVSSLERHANVLGDIERSSSGIAAGLAAVEGAANSNASVMEGLARQATQLQDVQSGLEGAAGTLTGAVHALVAHIEAFDKTTTRADELIGARLAQVRAAPDEIATTAIAGVEAAAERIRVALETIVEMQDRLSSEMARTAGASVAAVGRHNEALERELARSRENVAKVHSALVDMTGRLAERLEGGVA